MSKENSIRKFSSDSDSPRLVVMMDTANQGDINTINKTGPILISTYLGQIYDEKEQEITTRQHRRAPDINKKGDEVYTNLAIAVEPSDEEALEAKIEMSEDLWRIIRAALARLQPFLNEQPGRASCLLGNNASLYMRRALKWCESIKIKDSKICGTKRGICGIIELLGSPTLSYHPLITSFLHKHSQYKISRSKYNSAMDINILLNFERNEQNLKTQSSKIEHAATLLHTFTTLRCAEIARLRINLVEFEQSIMIVYIPKRKMKNGF
ncbi:MAG: hypothetical protein EZS28_031403, partial [Streblomastix strix]